MPPAKASSSARHHTMSAFGNAAAIGLALISKARSAPPSPRSARTPSRVAGAAALWAPGGWAAFLSVISSPPSRMAISGSAAASISVPSNGKNAPVGLFSPARAVAGTEMR